MLFVLTAVRVQHLVNRLVIIKLEDAQHALMTSTGVCPGPATAMAVEDEGIGECTAVRVQRARRVQVKNVIYFIWKEFLRLDLLPITMN